MEPTHCILGILEQGLLREQLMCMGRMNHNRIHHFLLIEHSLKNVNVGLLACTELLLVTSQKLMDRHAETEVPHARG